MLWHIGKLIEDEPDNCNEDNPTGCAAAPFLATGLTLISCDDNAGPDQIAAVVEVTEDTVLCRDYTNVKFVIKKDNVSLDLGGHTLTNNTDNVTIAVHPKLKNVEISNGVIDGKWSGSGIHFNSTYRPAIIPDILNNTNATENLLWSDNAHGNSSVHDIVFNNIATSVYVDHYISGVHIFDNRFEHNERMAIYLDASSRENVIERNYFLDNGFRPNELFKRRRGHISVDGSMYNVIRDNTFTDTERKRAYLFPVEEYDVPAIEFYRNCGQVDSDGGIFPRLHGADHNQLSDNVFNGVALAIWFRYREHDQLASCNPVRYPDKADYNTVVNSTLNGVDQYVIDEGVGNAF